MKLKQTKIEDNCPPVLLIIFNRPDLTEQVFRRIREVQPKNLFIAADGPRHDVLTDEKLCEQTRRVIDLVDWECEVHKLFREKNLGCKQGVSTAITWFFEHVESGIILEDDCLPHTTFFPFCDDLLERYFDDERIMLVSGSNFQQGKRRTAFSYYFSRYPHIWGWATWRRAWNCYDGNMKYWPLLRDTPWLFDIHGNRDIEKFWRQIFDRAYTQKIDSWGYPWIYSCWVQSGLAILPEVNLVSNIGFDERATHTKVSRRELSNLSSHAIEFPLQHPPFVIRHSIADIFTFSTIYRPASGLHRHLKRIPHLALKTLQLISESGRYYFQQIFRKIKH